MLSLLRTMFQGARQGLRAMSLVRFALWGNGPYFDTYEAAVRYYRMMTTEERRGLRYAGRSPILVWWPGKGWVETPWSSDDESASQNGL